MQEQVSENKMLILSSTEVVKKCCCLGLFQYFGQVWSSSLFLFGYFRAGDYKKLQWMHFLLFSFVSSTCSPKTSAFLDWFGHHKFCLKGRISFLCLPFSSQISAQSSFSVCTGIQQELFTMLVMF